MTVNVAEALPKITENGTEIEMTGKLAFVSKNSEGLAEIKIKASNREKKSELIMEAALNIFTKKNFKDVTISEIAEQAGVAVGTVYEYFDNKEDLYFTIPKKSTELFVEQLRLHLESLCSPIEKLRKYIWFYLYFSVQEPIFTELLLMELRVSKNYFSVSHQTNHQHWLRIATADLLNMIKEGQQCGEIRSDISPYLIRHMVLGVLEHVTTYWLLKEMKHDLLSLSKDITSMVLSSIIANQDAQNMINNNVTDATS